MHRFIIILCMYYVYVLYTTLQVYVCVLVDGFRYMYVSMTISLKWYSILPLVIPILLTVMILNSLVLLLY